MHAAMSRRERAVLAVLLALAASTGCARKLPMLDDYQPRTDDILEMVRRTRVAEWRVGPEGDLDSTVLVLEQDSDEEVRRRAGEARRAMERINIAGAADSGPAGTPAPCTAAAVAAHDGPVVDVRPVNAFQGAHWPGSLCLPVGMLSAFAGWYLEEGTEILLVADDGGQAAEAARRLGRIGFDRVAGYFDGLVPATAGGHPFGHLPVVSAAEVARRRRRNAGDWTLLDVRDIDEWTDGHVPGAVHAYVGRLPEAAERLDPERRITTMCASGARATVAAGWLKANGFGDVDVFLGSMGAWRSREGEVESGPDGG